VKKKNSLNSPEIKKETHDFFQVGFQLTTLLVIGTDGIDSYKSNYHTITTAACKILTIKDLQQTSL
jgi:hypothetical protein